MPKPPRQPARDESTKEQIYEVIQKKALDKGTRISRVAAKEIFDSVIDVMFAGMLKDKDEGYFRFPLGYGILRVKRFKARPAKAMPTRENLPVAPIAKPETRLHVRYHEGATVRKALGTYKGVYQRQGDRVPLALKRRG